MLVPTALRHTHAYSPAATDVGPVRWFRGKISASPRSLEPTRGLWHCWAHGAARAAWGAGDPGGVQPRRRGHHPHAVLGLVRRARADGGRGACARAPASTRASRGRSQRATLRWHSLANCRCSAWARVRKLERGGRSVESLGSWAAPPCRGGALPCAALPVSVRLSEAHSVAARLARSPCAQRPRAASCSARSSCARHSRPRPACS